MDSVVATVGVSLATFLLFAIQGILLARMLGVEERGKLTAVMVYPQALLYLGLLGAPELFAGYAARNFDPVALRRSAFRYGCFAAALTGFVCLILEQVALPTDKRAALWITAVTCLAFGLQQIRLTVQAVDHGRRNMVRYNVCRLVAAAAYPIGLLVCYQLGAKSLTSAVWTLLIASWSSLLLCQIGMTASWRGESSVSIREGLREAKHLVGAWFVSEIAEKLDVCLMVWMFADKIVGFYSAAVPIAGMMIIVPNAVGLYAFNRGARNHERPKWQEVMKLVLGLLGFQILAGLVMAFLIPIAIPLLYREEFRDAIPYALLLLPAAGIRGIIQAADGYLRGRKIFRPTVVARLLGIAILLGGSFLMQPTLGSYAIPVMYDLAQAVVLLIVVAAIFRDVARHSADPAPAEATALVEENETEAAADRLAATEMESKTDMEIV